MMCTTVLHGGVCHRTSTPHKSGNKMKEKKKIFLNFIEIAHTDDFPSTGTQLGVIIHFS